MGQKVNPYGFRLGITTDWKSRWFEERHYRDFVVEDWKIRDYLMRQLEAAALVFVVAISTLAGAVQRRAQRGAQEREIAVRGRARCRRSCRRIAAPWPRWARP